jgi:DNA-binding response OmpR family regulator
MAQHIFLVDDDELLRRSLTFSLEQAGFRVNAIGNAEDALALARRDAPDLVLLDIGLPGMDGLEALRLFRDQMQVPVVFLTARRRELDEVLGLELGADDYITKPVKKDVLLAHIRAVLRRPQHVTTADEQELKTLTVGDLTINASAHTVRLKGQPIELPPREFDLLYTLALEAGRVVPVEALLSRVWGAEFVGEPQVVYVHVRWLREKLEQDPHHPQRIITMRGVGYKLEPQET